ncbi:hypothetical protein [Streptomyces griseorubens]|uniref:hypothetical protein n=1 Tax=Streptomyces griseorubens TaxID=66897 RepID=UPI00351587B2
MPGTFSVPFQQVLDRITPHLPPYLRKIEPTPYGRVRFEGSVAKIVKLEHAWRRLDGRNDDGFQVAPFPG